MMDGVFINIDCWLMLVLEISDKLVFPLLVKNISLSAVSSYTILLLVYLIISHNIKYLNYYYFFDFYLNTTTLMVYNIRLVFVTRYLVTTRKICIVTIY